MTTSLLAQIFTDTENISEPEALDDAFVTTKSGALVQLIRLYRSYDDGATNNPKHCDNYVQRCTVRNIADARDVYLPCLDFAESVGLTICDLLDDLKGYKISEVIEEYRNKVNSVFKNVDSDSTRGMEKMLVVVFTDKFAFVALLTTEVLEIQRVDVAITVLIVNGYAVETVLTYIKEHLSPPEASVNFLPSTCKFETLH